MPPEEVAPISPVVVPPADQPPPKGERIRNFVTERFAAKLAEMGGDDDESNDERETTETETPAKAVPKADKKPVAAPDKPPPAAADDAVKPSERAEFREYKRQQQETINKRAAELDKREQELSGRSSKADLILKAIEAGDPEGFAQAVGTKDFNEFQESFIKRLADPNYKEVQELKQWKADQEKQKKEAEENEAQSAKQREIAQKREAFMTDLKDKSSKSTDKLAQVMHDDPMFLNVVFRIIGDHYESDGLIPVEAALDRGVKGSKTTLRSEMKGLYEKLRQVFAEPPPLAEANGRKPAPKTSVTPVKTTETEGGPGKWDGPNDPKWKNYRNRKFSELTGKD